MPVLGLAGCHWRKWKLVQVHRGDQSPLPPLWNSFVGTGIHNGPVPSAICNLAQTKTRKISQNEALHLFRWFTHTHTYIYIYIERERERHVLACSFLSIVFLYAVDIMRPEAWLRNGTSMYLHEYSWMWMQNPSNFWSTPKAILYVRAPAPPCVQRFDHLSRQAYVHTENCVKDDRLAHARNLK